MKRKMRKEITKEWLLSQHVGVVPRHDGSDLDDVFHDTPKWGFRQLTPVKMIKKHKYGKTMEYYVVGWYCREEKKQYAFPIHRIIYAWYHPNESIEGLDIDHINGNSLDNRIDNLRAISHKQNMQERFNGGANQYKNCNTKKKEE